MVMKGISNEMAMLPTVRRMTYILLF